MSGCSGKGLENVQFAHRKNVDKRETSPQFECLPRLSRGFPAISSAEHAISANPYPVYRVGNGLGASGWC